MSNSLGEYRKEVEEKLEMERQNRDKLIEQIESYDLVDEKYKNDIKQEILQNFEVNENNTKEDETYKLAIKKFEEIETKRNSLNTMEEELKNNIQEKSNIEQKLRERKFDSSSGIPLKHQRAQVNELGKQLKAVESQIEEMEKSIKDYKSEIEEMEKTYGKYEKKYQKPSNSKKPTVIIQKKKDNKKKDSVTLDQFREKTLKDLRRIDQTRHEIIKLLNEGAGIGDDLPKKIEEEVSSRFFDYYDEKQGSLTMKASRFFRNRERSKFLDKNNKDKRHYERLNAREDKERKKSVRKLLNESDFIDSSIDIGGIPTFKVKKDGKWSVVWGDQILCEGAEYLDVKGDVGGKPVVWAKINGLYSLFWGDQVLCINVDDIREINDISGIPVCLAKEYGGWSVIRGDQVLCEGADFIGRVRNVGGFPAFHKTKNGKKSVIWGNQTLCEGADNIWHLKDMGGKPAFCAEICGKYSSFWGDKVLCEGADNICESRCFEGKPVFAAKMYGKWNVIWGDKVLYEGADDFGYTDSSGHYDWFENYRIKSIGGKLVFSVKINGMWCVIWGDKILYKGAGKIFDIQDSGGVPVFSVCEECKGGKNWKRSLFYGDQILCEGADRIYTLEGETAVRASKINGKYSFFWKDKIICEGVDDIREIRYHHDKISIDMIGGKPAFEVMINGKYSSFWGDQALCEGADSIGRYRDIGGKPVYCANINGKWNIIWGEDILYEGVDDICEIKDFGGIPTFSVKINGKWRMIWGDKVLYEGADDIGYEDVIVGGKLAFSVKINGKWRVIWGDKVLYEGDNDVGKRIITSGNSPYKIFYIKDIGGKPAFAAEVNGKWNIIWGEDILYKEADNILFLENVGGNPVFKVQKNGEIISYPDLKTHKEIREQLLSNWQQKEKNRDNLLTFLLGLLDDKNFNEIQGEILEDFTLSFENAKTDKEFQTADNFYKDIERLTEQHKIKSAELKEKENEVEKEYKDIVDKMGKIGYKAMSLENGPRWKKLKLKNTMSERDKLEIRQREINNDIKNLRSERDKIEREIHKRKLEYGETLTTDTKIRENANPYTWEKYRGIGINQKIINEKEIDGYEKKFDEIIKDKTKSMEIVLAKIKSEDLGISDKMKEKVIDTVKAVISQEIESLKGKKIELVESLKLAYKRNHFNLNWKERKDNVGTLLWLLSTYSDEAAFEKIQNEILGDFYVNYEKAKLDENFESRDENVDSEGKKQHEIKIKDNGNFGKYEGANLEDLKNESTLKGYKEIYYNEVLNKKKEYMETVLAKIEHDSLGISDDLKKRALKVLGMNMRKEIEEMEKGDETLQKLKEIEEWFRTKWDSMMKRLSHIDDEILTIDERIKQLELKRESAKREEFEDLFDKEESFRQNLLDLKDEKSEIISEINENLKLYDGTNLNIPEDIKLSRHERFTDID